MEVGRSGVEEGHTHILGGTRVEGAALKPVAVVVGHVGLGAWEERGGRVHVGRRKRIHFCLMKNLSETRV
jgi:hypothetical protein